MKKLLLALFFISFTVISVAQSNKDIAKVYIKRSQEALGNLEIQKSVENFEKAMKYTDTIVNPNVAELGAKIYYEVKNYEKCLRYFKQYFLVNKNKNSKSFDEMMTFFVTTKDEYDEVLKERQRIEEERKRKEAEMRRIDSLKTVWETRSNELSIAVDSIYKFNKKNTALYTKDGKYGIINDIGDVVLEADEYSYGTNYDGYFLLMDKPENPTKIYYYNINANTGAVIPPISDFNPTSSHYGKVMFARSNGRIVTYPDNYPHAFVYDLEQKKQVKIANLKEVLKSLKKNDIISKYDDDESTVKINKIWYKFGGHLGGGVYVLFDEAGSNLVGFFFTNSIRKIVNTSEIDYLGIFDKSRFQAINDGDVFWVNQQGVTSKNPKDESGVYTGNSVIGKLSNGNYQIKKDGVIVLGEKKLEKLEDFLRNNNPNKED